MGNCASPHITRNKGGNGSHDSPNTAKIIHLDGRLQEFKQPIKAGHILSQNPNCFLCSSESMYLDCHVPHVPRDEELQLGQMYLLMPLSQSHAPLSLQTLCALAIKASASLAKKPSTFSSKSNGIGGHPAAARKCCQITISGLDSIRMN